MSKEIISFDKYKLSVNIFYGGKVRDKCVQFTTGDDCYSQMTYEQAIKFLKETLKKLKQEKN